MLNGEIQNTNGNVNVTNNNGAVNITGDILNLKGNTNITNTSGNISLTTANIQNNYGNTNINANTRVAIDNSQITNANGDLTVTANSGISTSNSEVANQNGNLTYDNKNGNVSVTNSNIMNKNGSLTIKNAGNGKVTEDEQSTISNTEGILTIDNSGSGGIDISGNITQSSSNNNNEQTIKILNTAGGVNLNSSGRINNTNRTLIDNSGSNGINVKGIVTSKGIDIENKNSNVVIGDTTSNTNYLTSTGRGVNINITNGNLYNAGVAKTLIAAQNGGNLNIHVEDGSIGQEPGICADGVCTGLGADARDLTKSINANVDGTYTAVTTRNNSTNDLSINLAAIDSDMKIDYIDADGRAILLADASTKGERSYDIINAASDKSKANVTGKGISIIASGPKSIVSVNCNRKVFLKRKYKNGIIR